MVLGLGASDSLSRTENDTTTETKPEAVCLALSINNENEKASLGPQFAGTTHGESELSVLINKIVTDLYTKHHARLRHSKYLTQDHFVEQYSAAIHNKGNAHDVFGFIDGTMYWICRPSIHQSAAYTGYKRAHVLKYQGVSLPNGMIASATGPYPGRWHDSRCFYSSGVANWIDGIVPGMRLGGDNAYATSHRVIVVNNHPELKRVRVAVEWGFGNVANHWRFLRFSSNLRVGLSPVGKYIALGFLLTNCHVCLYGCEASTYFHVSPPRLESYLFSP
ncbi:hypothetical protein PTSG_00283 [Salpingoeca rosetta]|uniref:DDE Tnp4 domain-containing protein n=1 Tax=Salpingoeca rosetta (strain ATCC 50818 / BSB-021) TaxID=946362 RepID=F2TW17_SALR5|nr:uncharacterized protein PTSG_00283 [Salpingoeca rosetta]EGD72263.1 hypothetical protein PTSG_00283 [Salpingoeca rosetta]|eukprot:XP_004998834.1 hypothetical protein PTSG_00283 [Salpingoeca rosetta]